jgi:hypothetical protein
VLGAATGMQSITAGFVVSTCTAELLVGKAEGDGARAKPTMVARAARASTGLVEIAAGDAARAEDGACLSLPRHFVLIVKEPKGRPRLEMLCAALAGAATGAGTGA